MSVRVLLLLVLLLLCGSVAVALKPLMAGHSAEDWGSGRRIYHIMTDRFALSNGAVPTCTDSQLSQYCGGTFVGITNHLDYIAGMGFNAIMISPVIANTATGYHGYYPQNFFAINPHFGTEEELTELVEAAHARGIWVMADIIMNHVGPVPGSDFGPIQPFNLSEYYHAECLVTGDQCLTQETLVCRLSGLPDLNQTQPYVSEQLQLSVSWLLSTFKFDGLRAAAALNIDIPFWTWLHATIPSTYLAGVVCSDFGCNQQYTNGAAPLDGTANFALFYTLQTVFAQQQSMRNLGNVWRQQMSLSHPGHELNFVDDLDNSRFLSVNGNINSFKSALAHAFFTTGIPTVLYGTEQAFNGSIIGNQCQEPLWDSGYDNTTDMYHFLSVVNGVYDKMSLWDYPVQERWQDDTMYCLIRGQFLLCTTNGGAAQTRTIPNLPFDSNMMVCNAFDRSDCTAGAATMAITIPQGGHPLLLFGVAL